MTVHSFTLGPLENNCFVVENDKRCIIIDVPMGIEPLIAFIKNRKLDPEAVLLTHGHFDHIGGLAELKQNRKIPIYIYRDDAPFLVDDDLNGSVFFGFPGCSTPADKTFEDGQVLEIAGMKIKVLHTPGHTAGGVCFLIEKDLFAGDTLFNSGVGRTDLPGGSMKAIKDSIRSKLFKLPPDTRVYPGHGPETTIDFEMKSNPFVR